MEQTKRKQARKGMDMLHGSIADKLFFFAMPVGLMGMFEQLLLTSLFSGGLSGKMPWRLSGTICLSSAFW